MGTVRADEPRLDARGVGAVRQPRRLAFGRGSASSTPTGLEVRSGPLEDELAALAREGVQSLLLEGGPTLATAFLREGLVDKLIVFVAPVLSGSGPHFLGGLDRPLDLSHLTAARSGEDVRIEAYVRVP
jgi:diaminohydroxyphosphoribosylaminopyrimidine deaminase/5-amino-6-(5-phosphoribosylamino)uracil reductase